MKKLVLAVSVSLMALAPLAPAEAQWVFLARKASQRIQHMTIEGEKAGEPRREFVTVILEAPADRVYQTVLETIRHNPNARLLSSDPAARRLQVAEGDRIGTVNVASMRICAEMKKQCSVD